MSFRIPTLEEARKKQEASLSQNKYNKLQSLPSKHVQTTSKHKTNVSNTQTIATSTSTTVRNNNTNYINHTKQKSSRASTTSESKVINPYLKYRKNKSIQSSAVVVKSQNNAKSQHTKHDNITTQYKSSLHRNTHTKGKPTPLHLLNDPNAKTFSQAFKSIDYVSDAQNNHDKKTKQQVDEEEQRALDASMVLSQLEREQRSTEMHLQDKKKMARDNHALLQPHILHGKKLIYEVLTNIIHSFTSLHFIFF